MATELKALQLYEQSKDPEASLAKYHEVWNAVKSNEDGDKTSQATTGGDETSDESKITAVAQRHNEGVLTHLSSLRRRRRRAEKDEKEKTGDLVGMLSSVVNDLSADDVMKKRGEYNRLVAVYNLGLVHYSSGRIDEALKAVLPEVSKIVSVKKEEEGEAAGSSGSDEAGSHVIMVAIRMVFLVLDCVIRRHDGHGLGVSPLSTLDKNGENVTIWPEEILTWVETNVLTSTNEVSETCKDSCAFNKDELKFRLHLYRSKLLFLGNASPSKDTGGAAQAKDKEDMGTRARLSRKELKGAMDLYQNKMSLEKQQDDKYNDNSSFIEKTNKLPEKPKGGSNKLTKSRGSNQSDVSSVTSVAGGSLVTSTSDALWNSSAVVAQAAQQVERGVVVTGATFEGMPNKQQQVATSAQPVQDSGGKVKKDNPDLHVEHEAVLYLKANLECLRGNTTKSLKLCSEARLAGRRSRVDQTGSSEVGKEDVGVKADGDEEQKDATSHSNESQMSSYYDEAIYYNNLALVHQSAGKFHLALHYYSFALECMSNASQLETQMDKDDSLRFFWSDGVARPDITAEILNNTSVSAFQGGDFKKAYDCMARCMSISPEMFGRRPRCWLRMGQSCIGMYVNIRNNRSLKRNVDSTEKKEDFTASPEPSSDGIDNALSDLLPKAASCLYRAIYLTRPLKAGDSIDLLCYETAIVSLVYTKMEMNDTVGALEACRILLGSDTIGSGPETSRNHAACRLYAAEAHCLLGDAKSALTVLFGSDNISEVELKKDVCTTDSPLHWLAKGYSIEGGKKSKGKNSNNSPNDSQTVLVKKLLEQRSLLYQLLKDGNTEVAVDIIKGVSCQ